MHPVRNINIYRTAPSRVDKCGMNVSVSNCSAKRLIVSVTAAFAILSVVKDFSLMQDRQNRYVNIKHHEHHPDTKSLK
jgi:hypothetical protein